jgi:TolB-like protein
LGGSVLEARPTVYSFGAFELDAGKFELRESGRVVPVEPRAFQVLAYLVENQERMVPRDELGEHIWHGRIVSEWALSAAVKSARKALRDTGSTKRYIRTIHGKGFRFVGAAVASTDATRQGSGAAARAQGQLSVAVLPLVNLTGDAELDYVADGISDDLITDLAGIGGLRVLSRNATFMFKGQAPDLGAVAERLNAGYVVEGSVRSWGAAIRINVRLIDAANGTQLWAQRHDGSRADIFALQDDIAARIVSSLRPSLGAARRIIRRSTCNPEAYELCLRGRSEYYRYTPDHLAKALGFFEQAVAKDPTYAEPYAYQSYCRCSLYVFAWPGADDTLDEAVALGEKAVALDGESAVAHARLGWVLGFLDRIEETVATFERAVALAPDNAEVYLAYGETMNRLARPESALPLIETAFSIDTFVPPSWQFTKGHSFTLMGRYEEALNQFLPVLERVPGFMPARVQLARTYAEMGRSADASETVRTLREIAPRYRLSNAGRMFPYPEPAERKRIMDALRDAGLPA